MNPIDYGDMVRKLMPQYVHQVGDVVKGPPNWFNQGLPVKGMDPLGEAMGRQGLSPTGPSPRDSAQTSFGGAPLTPKPTPKYDALIGKLRNAGATMSKLDRQSSMNQYSAWAHQFGISPSSIQSIIKQASELGMGRDQFMFMLAKFKQDGTL